MIIYKYTNTIIQIVSTEKMNLEKSIQNIQKQNDSIYSSLVAKNIIFERTIVPDEATNDERLKLLNEENTRLKDVAKANKPIQEKQEKQQKQEKPQKQQNLPKDREDVEDDEGDEENYEEPIKKFDTITTNMEEIKKLFFSSSGYDEFNQIVMTIPFKFYKVQYKYNSDKDGVPDFSAKNLLKGFVRNFDDYRKYFMICFRCLKLKDKQEFKYESYWIVNTNEPINNVIGSFYDDFEFEPVENINDFLSNIKKLLDVNNEEPVFIGNYECIGESFVH
jgi:hypothetical protein